MILIESNSDFFKLPSFIVLSFSTQVSVLKGKLNEMSKAKCQKEGYAHTIALKINLDHHRRKM